MTGDVCSAPRATKLNEHDDAEQAAVNRVFGRAVFGPVGVSWPTTRSQPMHKYTLQSDSIDTDAVHATIGGETFVGEIVERGFDGTTVVYVEDTDGLTRAVRPAHPTHELRPFTGGAR